MYNIHKHFYDIPQTPTETLLNNNVNKICGYHTLHNGHLRNHGSIPRWG